MRNSAVRLAFVFALLVACGPTLVWRGQSPDRRRSIEILEGNGQYVVADRVRGRTYDAIGLGALTFSADSRRLAYAARRAGQWRVVVDGEEGPAYAGIGELLFSADGRRVAYAAERGGSWLIVADGVEGPPFDEVLAHTLQFSRDGKRLAYAAVRGDQTHVVVDGVEGPGLDGAGKLAFSEDGARIAYLARRGQAAVAVVDGGAGPPYETISELVLGRRGARAGYLGKRAGSWHAVIDGVESDPWDLVAGLAFSSDGAHVAYAARKAQGDTALVLDGIRGRSYLGIRPASIAFGAGRAVPTFIALRADGYVVVHDGVEGPAFTEIRFPVLAAAGPRWAYAAQRGDEWFPVIDGVVQGPERWAGDPTISADGRRVAFVVRRGADMVVLTGGMAHRYDLVLDGTLVFDPSGRHWGCVAGVRAQRKFFIVVDGVRRAPIDVNDAINAAIHTRASGDSVAGNDELLRGWVAAEVAKVKR